MRRLSFLDPSLRRRLLLGGLLAPCAAAVALVYHDRGRVFGADAIAGGGPR